MAKDGVDLDKGLDALYASPPSEFVSARNALVKTLEIAGRKDDAARVKALKKPNAAAWGVNQLALSSPRVLAALVASGDRLRAKGSDPREAMQKRRDAVHEARREIERAFVGAGLAANSDVLRRVSATLEAIATYGSAPGGPVAGRLTEDVPAPGFDEIAALGILGGAPRAIRPAAPAPRPEARRALEERTREAKQARAKLQAAEKAVEAIRRRRTSLAAALSEVAAEEKALEATLAEARKAAEAADAAEREERSRSSQDLTGLAADRPRPTTRDKPRR